jgi:hypothetical protein
MKRCCASKGEDAVGVPRDGEWTLYKPSQRVGKLCYYLCSDQSRLPIRDVLNYHRRGFKKEPNCETRTYNWCAKCNGRSVRAAIKAGLSHILFITRYTGYQNEYHNRRFITGYYEIGRITKVPDKKEKDGWRYAIEASRVCFVPVERAYEWPVRNLRYATSRICGDRLKVILEHLEGHDVTQEYCREVERLNARALLGEPRKESQRGSNCERSDKC